MAVFLGWCYVLCAVGKQLLKIRESLQRRGLGESGLEWLPWKTRGSHGRWVSLCPTGFCHSSVGCPYSLRFSL